MKKLSQKRLVRYSARATENLVSQIGGKKTPASGAWLEKADGRVPGLFRIETKAPPTGKHRLTLKDWNLLWGIAVKAKEVAVFHIKLGPQAEIVLMRDVDFRGCGGDHQTCGAGVGIAASWAINVEKWMTLQAQTPHLYVFLGDGQHKSVLLRAMPHHDFIRLANKHREAMGC